MEQNKLVIDTANIHTSARASTHSFTYDECMKACMYEKWKIHTNPSSGLDGTTQTCYWYSKHTNICSCKHTLAHVWRVHEGMHVWKIAKTFKSIIRARWNNTNWLLTQQTYTHHVWRVHESLHVWKIESTHKSIIRARWNKTNLLLIQQTYTHLLLLAHARSSMTSAQRHACMENCKDTQIHHQG